MAKMETWTRKGKQGTPQGRQVKSNSRVPVSIADASDYTARRAYLAGLKAEVEAAYQAQIDKLEREMESATASWTREIGLIDERLREFHRRQHAEGGPTVLKLPHYKLTLNPQGKGTSTVTDKEALLVWAEENCPKAVVPPGLPTVDLSVLRGRVNLPDNAEPNSTVGLYTDDGERVPGIEVKVAERTWKIEETK